MERVSETLRRRDACWQNDTQLLVVVEWSADDALRPGGSVLDTFQEVLDGVQGFRMVLADGAPLEEVAQVAMRDMGIQRCYLLRAEERDTLTPSQVLQHPERMERIWDPKRHALRFNRRGSLLRQGTQSKIKMRKALSRSCSLCIYS